MSITPQNMPHSKLNDEEFQELIETISRYLEVEYEFDRREATIDGELLVEMLHQEGYSIDKIDHDISRGHSTASHQEAEG